MPGAKTTNAIPPDPNEAPTWGDYAGYLGACAYGAEADLATGRCYLADKFGAWDLALALSNVGKSARNVSADETAALTPAGNAALTP